MVDYETSITKRVLEKLYFQAYYNAAGNCWDILL